MQVVSITTRWQQWLRKRSTVGGCPSRIEHQRGEGVKDSPGMAAAAAIDGGAALNTRGGEAVVAASTTMTPVTGTTMQSQQGHQPPPLLPLLIHQFTTCNGVYWGAVGHANPDCGSGSIIIHNRCAGGEVKMGGSRVYNAGVFVRGVRGGITASKCSEG